MFSFTRAEVIPDNGNTVREMKAFNARQRET